MKRCWKSVVLLAMYLALATGFANIFYWVCDGVCTMPGTPLIQSVSQYQDGTYQDVWSILIHRVRVQPFNLVSLLIFIMAVLHTFFAHSFTVLSERLKERNLEKKIEPADSFVVEALRFLGEVEVVFGVWVVPLFLAIAYFYSWETAIHYIDDRHYLEPLFVVVIMVLASTKPIIRLAEDSLKFFAKLLGGTVFAWWWVIMTLGPISGSLITEPGAMTISAVLLGKMFYRLGPSSPFAYATLGLLFTNISVGGVFTNFAAPPVLMVSGPWNWDAGFMISSFGWKAVLGILIANGVYSAIFRKEFPLLEKKRKLLAEEKETETSRVPFWISATHVIFLAWVVGHSHYPAIFIGAFLLFLGFYHATIHFQQPLSLKPPILVGFFLAGIVVHGSLQGWWIGPLLKNAAEGSLLLLSAFLTSFNDNAEITFMATLIPRFSDPMKYAVVAGAVAGGGLTVIANAPNPLGQSILRGYFKNGISGISLLKGAVFPAMIMCLVFYLFR